MVIQEHPKSASSRRALKLPAFVAEMLIRRHAEQIPNAHDMVFPSVHGTVRAPANLRRQWRQSREEIGYEWVIPHTFRKTVATLAEDEEPVSKRLGHNGTAKTLKHYMVKTHEGPDRREVLEQIGQQSFTHRFETKNTTKDDKSQQQSTA